VSCDAQCGLPRLSTPQSVLRPQRQQCECRYTSARARRQRSDPGASAAARSISTLSPPYCHQPCHKPANKISGMNCKRAAHISKASNPSSRAALRGRRSRLMPHTGRDRCAALARTGRPAAARLLRMLPRTVPPAPCAWPARPPLEMPVLRPARAAWPAAPARPDLRT
jgi:hypothetical protein